MKFSVRNKDSGFTLIEILVSMGIAAVVLVSISNLFVNQNKAFHVQEQVNEMQQNARAAVDLMAREIKMAGYDPAGNGFVAIVTANANEVRFIADVDGDGDVINATEANEDIGYSLDAVNNRILRRDYLAGAAPGVTIAENITALTLQYLDAAGNVTVVAANIRQIRVSTTAQTSDADPNFPQNGGYRQYQLQSRITSPNLGF